MRVPQLLLAVAGAHTAACMKASEPCCNTCGPGKDIFFALRNRDEKYPECSQSCLKPGFHHFWKGFEKSLAKGGCASQGFTKYVRTHLSGIKPLALISDRYIRPHAAAKVAFCPTKLHGVFADIHDGDKKEVIIAGTSMTIKPFGNDQSWVVNTEVDTELCSATIDFKVRGKPNPPPVDLLATLWYSLSATSERTELEFTDPSGTLAPDGYPLNRWVELGAGHHDAGARGSLLPCDLSLDTVFADMHDGDEKRVAVSGTSMTIKPSGNDQAWEIKSEINTASCSAVVDFNVSGKPNPPPVTLLATLFHSMSATQRKVDVGFTDPSGTLARTDFPLNLWAQVSSRLLAHEFHI